MAYANQHLLLQFSGTLPGGEVWSCGIRNQAVTGTPSQTILQTVATGASALWSTFHAVVNNAFGAGVVYDLVTARVISPAGVTVAQAEASPGTPTAGASAANKPNQCAVVVTLVSTLAGRQGRGRMYLPALGGTITTAGRLGTTQRDSIADTAATLVDGLSDLSEANYVASRMAVQSQVGPTASQVVTIRVGDVWDTQRRRRDGMVESYTSRSVT